MGIHLQRTAHKYNAKSTVFNGRMYASKLEATVAAEIELVKKDKVNPVVKVEPQKRFELFAKNGTKIFNHYVDFLLTFKDGHQEAWEAKGVQFDLWKAKRDMFIDNYPDIPYLVITTKGRWYGKQAH